VASRRRHVSHATAQRSHAFKREGHQQAEGDAADSLVAICQVDAAYLYRWHLIGWSWVTRSPRYEVSTHKPNISHCSTAVIGNTITIRKMPTGDNIASSAPGQIADQRLQQHRPRC